MDEAVFAPDGRLIRPTELARGPWDEDSQHGGAAAGLLAWALERKMAAADTSHSIARISIEFVRPVALRPLTADARGSLGRTVGRWEASLEADGKKLARASAISAAERQLDVERSDGHDRLAFPASDEPPRIPGMPDQRSFYYTAMEARLARGSVADPGPASVWFRLRCPLVADQENSPLVRVLTAADFASGISWELPFGRYRYINADLTVYLRRLPRSEWIGVAARTTIERNGIGITETALYDHEARIGGASQALVVFGPQG